MNKAKGGVAFIVIGIILILFGAFVTFGLLISGSSELKPYTGVISSDINDVYDLGNVLVVDKYSYVESDVDIDIDYYLIAFTGENNEDIRFASLYVDEGMDIYEKLDNYSNDDTQYIGDLYIELCATADSMTTLDSDVISFYHDAMDTCSDILPGITDSGVAFTYYCEGPSAFPNALAEEKAFKNIITVIFAAVFAVGIVLLIVGINKQVKAKAYAAAMPQNPYYPANQPNVYYNPQNPQAGAGYQPAPNPWTNGGAGNPPSYTQQPQPGSHMPFGPQNTNTAQWNNGAPNAGVSGKETEVLNNNTNPYYTPPTENKNFSQANAPENDAPGNQQ